MYIAMIFMKKNEIKRSQFRLESNESQSDFLRVLEMSLFYITVACGRRIFRRSDLSLLL